MNPKGGPKNKTLEEQFEDLAQETIERAEQIPCSLREFSNGIRVMLAQFRHRLEQVEDELRTDDD